VGIDIEMLFVDEGFGFFDDDVFEEVMIVFDGLCSGGVRSVFVWLRGLSRCDRFGLVMLIWWCCF